MKMEKQFTLPDIAQGVTVVFDTDEHGAARATVSGADIDAVTNAALDMKNAIDIEACPEVKGPFRDRDSDGWRATVLARKNRKPVEPVDSTASVSALELNFRITNRLASMGIYRVHDLCVCSAEDLLRVPGFGQRSLREVEAALQRAGRSLREEDGP
jgi:DNA-directed RNA polymerase alpha subunit